MTDEEICGSEPPQGAGYGDCWCTLEPGHAGLCQCTPCTERNGAPGWESLPSEETQERIRQAAAAAEAGEVQDLGSFARYADTDDLRQRIAAALEGVLCGTHCHPHGVADAVMAVVQPELDQARANTLAVRDEWIAHYRRAEDEVTHLAQQVERLLSRCGCSIGPNAEGPDRDCPVHGEEVGQLRAEVAALRATLDRQRAAHTNLQADYRRALGGEA